MKFIESGTGIRTVDAGFEVLLPEDSAQADTARTVLTQFVIDAANFIPVKRAGPGNLDAEDRVLTFLQDGRTVAVLASDQPRSFLRYRRELNATAERARRVTGKFAQNAGFRRTLAVWN